MKAKLWFPMAICLALVLVPNLPELNPGSVRAGDIGRFTAPERFVLEKVQSGEQADLAKGFGANEAHRQVRAEFLALLLTGGLPQVRVHRHGVQVSHAVIVPGQEDRLELAQATVPYNVVLSDCVFAVKINGEGAHFKHNLRLDRSVFREEVHFLKMRLEKGLFLPRTQFNGRVNFNGLQIGDSLNAEGAWFAAAGPHYFGSLQVGGSVYFSEARFSGPVTFDLSRVGRFWSMDRVEFHQEASFKGLQVGASLWCRKGIFQGPADFTLMQVDNYAHFEDAAFHGAARFGRSRVGRDFLARGARFLSPGDQDYATFFYGRVGSVADFREALFQGPVDLSGLEVGLELRAAGARFLHERLGLEAIALQVATIADFTQARFDGPVNMSGAVFEGQLNASRATFRKGAEFPGINVGELAEFTDTIFAAGVNFSGARIGGKFLAHVKESGTILAGGIFQGPLLLRDARLFDLVLQGRLDPWGITDASLAQELTLPELNLEHTVVERNLDLQNIILGKLKAWNLTVKGRTLWQKVMVTGEADLRDSKFTDLGLKWVAWPTPGERKVRLGGLSYQTLALENQPAGELARLRNWLLARSPGLDWLEQSPFDQGNYLQLERFLQKNGHKQQADKVFISMKRRELWPQEWYEWLNPVFWGTLIFWDLPVGYGRKPLRIFWFGLAFVLAGAWVFHPRHLKGVDHPRREIFRRLLLSLDKFTPTLWDLGLDKKWQPDLLPLGLQVYNYFHKLMGRVFLAVFFFGVWAYFR